MENFGQSEGSSLHYFLVEKSKEKITWLIRKWFTFNSSFIHFYDVIWSLPVQSFVNGHKVVISVFQDGAVTTNACFTLIAVKSNLIFVFFTNVQFPKVILCVTRHKISNFFDVVATKHFQFFMSHWAFFTEEAITLRAVKLKWLSFIAASTLWLIFLPVSAVSLNDSHHLLVK